MPFLLVRGLCQELWHSNDQQLSNTGQLAWFLLKKKYPGYYFNDLKKISKEYVKIEKDDPENNIWTIHLWWDVFYHKWMHNFASFIIYIYICIYALFTYFILKYLNFMHTTRGITEGFFVLLPNIYFSDKFLSYNTVTGKTVWRVVMAMQTICPWVFKHEMTVDNHRAQCQYCTTDWDSHL